MRGFHQSIGRQLRTGMGQVGEQSGRSFTRSMLGSVNRGMKAVGAGITHTTRAIARAAQAIRPVDRAINGLAAGLRGTRLATLGMAGALTSMGQRAQVAVSMARDGTRLLSAGMRNVGVSASESGTLMYRLGTRLQGVYGVAHRAAETVRPALEAIGDVASTVFEVAQDQAGLFMSGLRGVGVSASAAGTTMYQLGQTVRGVGESAQRHLTTATTAVTNGFNTVRDTARTALGVGQDQARLLSLGMRNVGVSASEAGTGVYRLGTRLQGTYQVAQSVAGTATAGFQAVGRAAQTAGGVTARAFQTATAPVRGLAAGLRGTHTETTGLTGAMNTAGLAVNTAFTHGSRSVGLFASGLRGVGVSASESNSWMYKLGQTTTATLSKVGPGFRSAGEAITSAGSRVRQWAQDTTSKVGGLGAAFTRMGALGAAAIAAIGFGTLAAQVSEVALGAATTEAQLSALYGAAGAGAAEVNAVMDGMADRFRHLDMSAMRSGAVSLAYMGLQGEEAVGVLERLEKATTATGSGAVGMERAFAALTKGVNAGKFMMGELNQISDAGIPIYDALSDVLGVSIPEAQAMASDGAIGLSEVLEALSGDYGVWFPALLEGADNIGETFSGSWDSIKNTIVNGFATEMVPLFDRAAPLMARFASAVDTGFTALPGLLDRVKRALVDSGIVDAVTRFVDGVKAIASAALPGVRTFAEYFGGPLALAVSGVLLALGPLGDAFEATAGWMGENQELVELLGAALGGAAAAITAVYIAKGIWAAVTWGLAAALNATGIPLLIFAIAALVAGVIYAYRNFDGFRETVNNVAGAVRDAALWIWDNGLKPAFDGIVAGAKAVGEWCVALWDDYLQPAFTAIADASVWIWDNGLKPAFDGIVAGAKEVGKWASWLGDHLSTAWEAVSGFFSNPPSFSDIGDGLKRVGSDVTGWLSEKGSELADWLKGLPAMVWGGLVAAGESLRDWYTETFDPARLRGIGEDIAAQLIDGLSNLASDMRDRAVEAGQAVIAWASEFPGQVRDEVAEIGDAAISWAAGLPDRVRERTSELADAALEWVKGLPERVRTRLDETGSEVSAWFKGLPDRIKEWFDSNKAVEWVSDMKDKIVDKLGDVLDAAVEWGRELPDKIRTAIDNAANVKDWIIEWGPKILLGLVAVVAFIILAIPALLLSIAAAVLFILGVILLELQKWLWGKFTEIMETVKDAISSKIREVTDKFRELRDGVVSRVRELRDRVVRFFTDLRKDAVARVEGLRDRVTQAFTNARDWVVQRATNLRDRALSVFTNLRDRTVSSFTNLRDRATSLMTNARDWIAERATRLRDRVVSPMETLRDKVINAFEKARDGIRTAWNAVERITKKPVSFIVNTVYNDGIREVWGKVAKLVNMDPLPRITGFATGGVLPGYTPGRDVHTFLSPTGGGLELSGGEAIMRPEWTRAVGPGFVHQMNAAARAGGVSGVKAAMGFASGGIIPTQAFNEGGIWDRVSSFGSSLKSIFDGEGLAGAARAVLDPLMETMAGRFTAGRWAEAMIAVPKAIFDKLMTWFTDVIGKMLGGDGKKVADTARSYVGVSGNPNQFTKAFGMPGQPWCAMFVSEIIKEAKAQKAYNNIRSAAVMSFADSSMDSVTGVGSTRPGDLAVYRGKGPGNWGHINIIADENGGTVGGNESNGVRFYSNYSARAAKFMRPKFASGGIWNQNIAETSDALTHPLTRMLRAGEDANLYDSGGWLMPGWNAVQNATGRPEAVLTPSQSDALVRIASQRGRGSEGHTFNIHETRSARVTAKATTTALRDYEALHPVP